MYVFLHFGPDAAMNAITDGFLPFFLNLAYTMNNAVHVP
jgi:hypothetical protein